MHYKKYKSILSASNGMNIYRGCTHGCIYCDSRSKCYQMDHDFEDIEVKENAPDMLLAALRKKRARCMIGTGAMCDPYIPLEKELMHTRQCLEHIDRLGFGVTILTKSDLVLRDIDLLKSINNKSKAVVQMTLTTFDDDLCRIVEPNVCPTSRRFEVLCQMRDAGIPTVVWLCPILPFINDSEDNLRGILKYCKDADVHAVLLFGVGMTLREGNREYYYSKLDEHFPGLREKYEKKYRDSYSISCPKGKSLMRFVYDECQRLGIMCGTKKVFAYLNKFEDKFSAGQFSLF